LFAAREHARLSVALSRIDHGLVAPTGPARDCAWRDNFMALFAVGAERWA